VAGKARVALFKSMAAVLERLPEELDVALAVRISRFVGRRTRGARSNLSTNVAHALRAPNTAVDQDLLASFVERAFASYGQYWAESAKLPALKKSIITDRFVIGEGLEHLVAAKGLGRGIVIALPHIGSWEWGGSFLATLDMPMTAVAEELDPPELFQWFKKKREAIGINIEPLNAHAGTVLLQTLRDGGVVGLLCDRDIQDNGIDVEFFGERVTIPAGPATLALRTGATLVAAACYAGPGRDHFAVITPPIPAERLGRLRDDVQRVTQLIANELEGLIRRAPEQWHVLQPRFAAS
jgi:KDO2-lipid IV(A) lauroyltransferase